MQVDKRQVDWMP
jgi:hypothetical protein